MIRFFYIILYMIYFKEQNFLRESLTNNFSNSTILHLR